MLDFYRLADPAHRVPMPDRGGRLFGSAGETIDPEHPFYHRLIADGDLVIASRAVPQASPAGAPAGRRGGAGLRSEPRPSAGSTKSNAKES